MSESVECIVIGAGVVGLAIARELANRGLETIVVERHSVIGSETSSRNSEVIHAGIYYPYSSLKARLCVMGKSLLYDYCEHKNISHSRCGKLIVATSEKQLSILKNIQSTARANGVNDLILLSQSQSLAMEPQLRALGALHSPSTGIIDSHSFMLNLQGDLESAGGVVAFNSPILSGEYKNTEMSLNIGGEQAMTLTAKYVINCAGLSAQHIARQFSGLALANIPPLHYAKGNYYALQCKAPFSRLIYPVPEEAGLGIHYTMDLAGSGRFGPDVQWIDDIDYAVDPKGAELFYAQITRYWPDIKQGALIPAYSGIRPKLSSQGEPAKDFVIQDYADHGIKGLVNLFGIESPGLTASLAIAEYVAALLFVDNSAA
ncbi:NAD(P)/FAD-dependent oxidoreductase [Paraglaciecola sp. 25GB23A]|uniref:NAD(P)/FAD-dependent oxidoreductase n=1 Tax=Paraglaciecola sp. 25GB23A TaxID=3156068 RepID=UPI0032AFDAF1